MRASTVSAPAAPPAAGAVGTPRIRVEGREKVTGAARYAVEHEAEGVAHGWIVQARHARGEVRAVDPRAALAVNGVLAVLWHGNAPRLQHVDDAELAVLQSPRVAYRGQIVAAVVAETLETARQAAGLVGVDVAPEPHDVVLREDHPGLYRPAKLNAGYATDTEQGDVEAGLAEAAIRIDATYTTPAEHNNPLEPHATLALWDAGGLILYDSNQGAPSHRVPVAQAFGLDPERVRVIARHVGGGFGSKGTARPQIILAAMLASVVGRPVKLPVSRQQMFSFTGYRTPTIQRLRLGARPDGSLTAIEHAVVEQTSTIREFAEQTATPTRVMYAAPNRRTSHRLARLDVPTPSWMRAPGECPGMFALESAMDELAIACGIDPIELRVRNEPDTEPETGRPFSSRNLVACLREGARRFGWEARDPTPGARRDGRELVGTGVAASTYPAYRRPAQAIARAHADGSFAVLIGATDIGTGARTVLGQIAADALAVPVDLVHVEIGDSLLPRAPVAGGSGGTAAWGSAVTKACAQLRARLDAHGDEPIPADGIEVAADTTEDIRAQERLARHAFGAQFAEVRVDEDTGEVRVPRLLGVFAAGRIINPLTARSQFLGGMTMGLSMALFEESVMDAAFGDYLNHDLAQYHVAACADVPSIAVAWIDEHDERLNPMGSKGIGELGIVGTAAAIANAVHHATGARVRDLPIRPDSLLGRL